MTFFTPWNPQLTESLEKLFARARELERRASFDDLVGLLDRAAEKWPADDRLALFRARIMDSLGDFEAARSGYRSILARNPDHVEAVCALVLAGRGKDAGGLERVDRLIGASKRGSNAHSRLCYARARLLEEAGRYTEAFDAFREANRIQASLGGMDIAAKQRAAATVIRDLSPAVVDRHAGRGSPSTRPVFIVGMPRSGTSLTEQVLSRHPEICAVGEQTFLGEALRDLIVAAPRTEGPLPDAISGADPDAWRRAGDRYLERLEEIDRDSARVTDKLPANFALLPWIRLLLPRARIIHVRRHPLATLASCIRTPFADNLLSFTVEDWARFYGLYEALMARWRPMLGEQMLEVDYEELVGDLPAQARRMVDYLGLEWAEACLQPERAQRAVKTASFEQVRRGVHRDSVEKWRRYADPLTALEPLIEESRDRVGTLAGS